MNNVTIIPTTDLAPYLRKRVAAYVRVSTDKDEALHSALQQKHYYLQLISSRPDYELVRIYADEGISGTTMNRPEFQQMIADARNGKLDLIITKSVSRFARNTSMALRLIRELRNLGVGIYFESYNINTLDPNGEVLISALNIIAEEEARMSSERQIWKILKGFAAGYVNNDNRMLGYRMKNHQLYIVPEEAEIVREIFALYLAGEGYYKIAKSLNDRGLRTINDREFTLPDIGYILGNERYVGDMLLQKKYTVDFRTKERKHNNGIRPQYYVQDAHAAIISRDVFEKAAAMRKERGSKFRKEKGVEKAEEHLFAGLIVCEECGKTFRHKVNGRGTPYAKEIWTCRTSDQKGSSACSAKSIPDEILREKTKEVLEEVLGQKLQMELSRELLKKYIKQILVVDKHTLVYHFFNYPTKTIAWEYRSRKYSWTPEMKERARQRALANRRRQKNEEVRKC